MLQFDTKRVAAFADRFELVGDSHGSFLFRFTALAEIKITTAKMPTAINIGTPPWLAQCDHYIAMRNLPHDERVSNWFKQ